MTRGRRKTSGFTLVELILVLVIIAIIAGIVMPSVSAFSAGRASHNTATQIVSLANYARMQAIAEGRTYRLNFDTSKGAFWLTAQNGAVFSPPGNEYGDVHQLPSGVQWDISLASKANSQINLPPDEQAVAAQMQSSLSQPRGQENYLMQVAHQNGTYVEFDASGRTDPAQIKLTDKRGGTIEIAAASATELFHVLTQEEMSK